MNVIDLNSNEIYRRKPIKDDKVLDHKLERLNKARDKIIDTRKKLYKKKGKI